MKLKYSIISIQSWFFGLNTWINYFYFLQPTIKILRNERISNGITKKYTANIIVATTWHTRVFCCIKEQTGESKKKKCYD